MALNNLDKVFTPSKKEIKYLNKTFPQYKQSLVDFARQYFPDTYNDFSDASPGSMFIEMASYVGDVLSYYIDAQFRENLIFYAEEIDNIIAISQALGYKPKPSTAAITEIDIYQLCPAKDFGDNYVADEKYMLRLNSNMVVSAPEYGTNFRTIDIVNFADPTDREITVYAVDGLNRPQTYLIRKRVRVVAGTIQEYRQTFSSPQRFSKIVLPERNVLEIISVVDGSGNKWYEVDYLAQDLVHDDSLNTRLAGEGESVAPFYIMKLRRTPRRFVSRYNSNFYLELHFGSGVLDDTEEVINLEPKKIYNDEYEMNLASVSLDPSDFLSSKSYGLSPANTELIITYTIGGGIESNVPSAAITKISTIDVINDTSAYDPTERELLSSVVDSLAVKNSIPATGGRGPENVEEIRQNALAYFNAQNRLVTAEDYIVRTYAMPAKYGGISKAFVVRDEQISEIIRNNNTLAPADGIFVDDRAIPNIVNLYVLGYNQNKKLTRLNMDVKKNLKTYLENYRILTDEIRILDAFVVNIGVEFDIVVYKSFNMNEVLARSISAVSDFFNIDRWAISQPIILNDLVLQIAQVEGVQSVNGVKVFNRYKHKDGMDYEDYIYDIESATEKGVIYPSLDPAVFELRYPSRDIIGNAVQ